MYKKPKRLKYFFSKQLNKVISPVRIVFITLCCFFQRKKLNFDVSFSFETRKTMRFLLELLLKNNGELYKIPFLHDSLVSFSDAQHKTYPFPKK